MEIAFSLSPRPVARYTNLQVEERAVSFCFEVFLNHCLECFQYRRPFTDDGLQAYFYTCYIHSPALQQYGTVFDSATGEILNEGWIDRCFEILEVLQHYYLEDVMMILNYIGQHHAIHRLTLAQLNPVLLVVIAHGGYYLPAYSETDPCA